MFPLLRRVTVGITASCLFVQLAACSSTRFTPVDSVLSEHETKLATPPGLPIAGYVTTDGVNHPFAGTVTLENDYFVFRPSFPSYEEADTTAAARAKREPFRVPAADVTQFNSYHSSHPVLIIGVCAALAAGLVWLGQIASD